LFEIIHRDGKLVGPVPFPIASEEISALIGWPLLLRSTSKVVEAFDRWLEANAQGEAWPFRQMFRRASTGVSQFAVGR
jgi:hypothetical protein